MGVETLTFLISLPVALLTLYIGYKKTGAFVALVLFGAPILVNAFDAFVHGNQTATREAAFAVWSLLALYVVLHKAK